MRCLHCNKKLSLLKLAKGDSFCSPEHFDAYQLQLSKSAYERLISLPDEEVPRAPLVFKTPEVPKAELEADSAMARLSEFRAAEQPALPPLPRPLEYDIPPYAGFQPSPLPYIPPQVIFPNANDPVAAPPGVAFPVHNVDEAAGILNLHLRLSLSEAPPRNPAQVSHPLAPPESFPREIAWPSLASLPIDSFSDVQSDRMPAHGGSLVTTEGEPQPSAIEHVEGPPINFIEIDFVGPPAPVPVPSTPPADPVRPAARRVAFLPAPSFRERNCEPRPFESEASHAPKDWKLPPVLDRVRPPAQWSGTIPRSARFSENKAVAPKDASLEPVQGSFALPAAAGIRQPEKTTVEPYQWQPSDGPIDIARPPLPMLHQAARANDYAPPQPSPVRPNAKPAPRIDHRQILTASRDSLMGKVLETRPRGKDPLFRTPPAAALELSLPAILTPLAAWEGFKARTWENQVGRFSLPTSLADVEVALAPLPSLPIPGSHGLETANPAPSELISATRLPAPSETLNHLAVKPSTRLGSLFEREFTIAASADFGLSDWSATVPVNMVPTVDIGVEQPEVGLCALTSNWPPCLPVRQDLGLSKFLPVRKSPMLPPARSWPRLGALPQ